MEKVALEINGPITDPERFMADLRKHAPHLFTDGKDVPPPAPAAPRKRAELGAEPLLTPGEVAVLFRVEVKCVARWAREGKLHPARTLGGHRRYLEREVTALLRGEMWVPEGGWPETSAA